MGDVQIRFQVVMPAQVSVIARQVKNNFEPYRAEAGGTIEMLEMGTRSAEAMFADAQSRNTMLTWGLRFLGFVIMMIGFRMIFSILRVVASVVPLFGRIVGVGVNLVSGVLALSLSLVVIRLCLDLLSTPHWNFIVGDFVSPGLFYPLTGEKSRRCERRTGTQPRAGYFARP